MASKAQIKAIDRYNKSKTKTYCLRLNRETDKDLINLLESFNNKQGFIKDLMRLSNKQFIEDLKRIDNYRK